MAVVSPFGPCISNNILPIDLVYCYLKKSFKNVPHENKRHVLKSNLKYFKVTITCCWITKWHKSTQGVSRSLN